MLPRQPAGCEWPRPDGGRRPGGAGIRKVLEALLDGVIREEYPNERQALLAAVQQLAAS